MKVNTKVTGKASVVFLAGALLLAGCAGGPLSTREKGAGIGAFGGAAAGGLIGAAVGHPGVGAAVGYIPLRLLDLEGLPKWPRLKTWCATQSQRPSFKHSAPVL